jgi:hypothetical protein
MAPAADRRPGGQGRPGDQTKHELETAYRQATKTATRSSLLGAMGFGVALLMLVVVAERGQSPSPTPVSLEQMLMFGGVFGGVVFTLIAARASHAAKVCRRQLDDASG